VAVVAVGKAGEAGRVVAVVVGRVAVVMVEVVAAEAKAGGEMEVRSVPLAEAIVVGKGVAEGVVTWGTEAASPVEVVRGKGEAAVKVVVAVRQARRVARQAGTVEEEATEVVAAEARAETVE
jgi:hypothetical protein